MISFIAKKTILTAITCFHLDAGVFISSLRLGYSQSEVKGGCSEMTEGLAVVAC
jgi:hypothetical protein